MGWTLLLSTYPEICEHKAAIKIFDYPRVCGILLNKAKIIIFCKNNYQNNIPNNMQPTK